MPLPPRTSRLLGARGRAESRLLARRGERGLAHHRRGGRRARHEHGTRAAARAACVRVAAARADASPILRRSQAAESPPHQAQARSAMSDLLAMQRAVWRAKRSTTEKIVLLAILDHY